jgi:outer membrane protein OmpA-like peptidoglycan-associated protein
VNEKGIAKSRLKVESKGESKPIVPGSETEHRPKNRRVAFEVIKK